MNLQQFQADHAEWLKGMFPGQLPWQPAACMAEEAGELFHAVLKYEQSKQHGAEPRYAHVDWNLELVDVIGDCIISACSLCNANGWDFAQLVRESAGPPMRSSVVELASELMQQAAKQTINPSSYLYAMHYMALVRSLATMLSIATSDALERTWGIVRRRSRDTPPKPRIVCLCGSTRFYELFQEANYRETMNGNIVLSVGFYPHALEHHDGVACTTLEKIALDALHFRKIELADEILVLDKNVIVCGQCGKPCEVPPSTERTTCCSMLTWNIRRYIGASTSNEIVHAKRLGKPIRYWSQEHAAE